MRWAGITAFCNLFIASTIFIFITLNYPFHFNSGYTWTPSILIDFLASIYYIYLLLIFNFAMKLLNFILLFFYLYCQLKHCFFMLNISTCRLKQLHVVIQYYLCIFRTLFSIRYKIYIIYKSNCHLLFYFIGN